MIWNKGDIIMGRRAAGAIHPIIFLEGHDDEFFIGAMITSSSPKDFPDNIPMLEKHFEEYDETGKKHKTCFGPSYLVDARLLKRVEWRPFRKTGRLTHEGIHFVESKIKGRDPMLWEDYKQLTEIYRRE